jgi:putative membrane protein
MMSGNDYGMGYGMGFGGIFMWIFWIALILLVVWAIGALLGRRGDGGGGLEKSALDILQERYAKGEIGREEYEQKRKDLEG